MCLNGIGGIKGDVLLYKVTGYNYDLSVGDSLFVCVMGKRCSDPSLVQARVVHFQNVTKRHPPKTKETKQVEGQYSNKRVEAS
jgi:hypothetical protein